MKKRVTVKPYRIVPIFVALLLCVVIVRLSYVCLSSNVDGVDLKAFADNRNTVTKTLFASRGTIYDSSGDALAQNVNSYTLIAYLSPSRTKKDSDPQHVVDKEATAEALAPILGVEPETILKRLNKKDVYQVEFGTAGKLNEIQKEKVEALGLPGLDFILSTTRYYKMGTFASYIVGYAKGNDDGEIQGELGIESYYDSDLKGTNGSTTYQQDAKGYKMANVPEYRTEATNGADIRLTIDSNIQLIAETAMKNLSDNYVMDWGLIAVMEAKTGAIVASATYPTFNPNDLSTIKSYLNPLVSTTYEPGSTMKIFSFASAIESGNYKGSDTYKSGSVTLKDGTVIRDSNREGWGTITFDTGFAYSSNVAATILARKMGVKTLSNYYEQLGFGNITGIELSGEVKGNIDFNYESELATAAFGQGVSITPIQMLQALTAIANNGTILKPYIVEKITANNGKVLYEGKRTEVRKVFSKETTDYMQGLMYDVVYNGLTKQWQPKNISIIAKTGTAQIASPKGGYLNGEYDYVTSLAGMFPKEDPQYIIYIVNKKMQGPRSAQSKAITKVIDEIASYAKLIDKQNTPVANPSFKMGNYLSDDINVVKGKLEEAKLIPYIIGDGKYVISQYPDKGANVFAGNKVFIKTNSDNILLADLTGMSASEVNTYASLINKKILVNGYGYVVSQSIDPGTKVTDDIVIEVNLE